ncbi:MAG: lysophospholipid acyltransferase family protein [Lentisphaeria bacterium]|nr:lysophospholipid acyltransferase family protein [Lentisphaeria bacterium]
MQKIYASAISFFLQSIIHFRLSVIQKHVDFCFPEKTAAEKAQLIKKIYKHFGFLLVELISLPGKELDASRIIIHGEENLQKAIAKGNGVFVMGGHFANWEFFAKAFLDRGYIVSAVSKKVKGKAGQTFLKLIRESTGTITIPKKNSIRTILKTLKKNQVICMMMDQNMITSEGVFVDFFNGSCCTSPGMLVLAKRQETAILPIRAYRDEDHYHMHLEILPEMKLEYPSDDKDENILHNLKRCNKFIEEAIIAYPDQWIWMHKRWKSRPENEKVPPINYK